MCQSAHSADPLIDFLQDCTVRVNLSDGLGTGFWVSPGCVLTCAHIINAESHDCVSLTWKGVSLSANVTMSLRELDIAVLEAGAPATGVQNPCVLLEDSALPRDQLFCFGYTDEYPDGDSATPEMEGWSKEPTLIKLKGAQIRPGFSGAPLLNQHTGAVCGMVTKTRDRDTDLGGRAIPTFVILSNIPGLQQRQQRYHRGHRSWIDLLPRLASEDVRSLKGATYTSAARLLEDLQSRGCRIELIIRCFRELWSTEVDLKLKACWCHGLRDSSHPLARHFLKTVASDQSEDPFLRREAGRALG